MLDGGEWWTGNLIEYCESDKIVYYISKNDTSSGIFRLAIDPETISQCTGLTDKNGKLIFEDDICKKETLFSYIVYWCNEQANFDVKHTTGRVSNFVFDVHLARQIEVIGNVHDNPELLERLKS